MRSEGLGVGGLGVRDQGMGFGCWAVRGEGQWIWGGKGYPPPALE